MDKTIKIEEIKGIMDKLLEATHDLAESHPQTDEKLRFIRVLEGIYRRSTFTFLAIRYLANKPPLADSAEVLSRKMIEDVIHVEYMLLNDKEEMAKRFQDFFYVQAYQEYKHRKKLGYQDPPKEELDNMLKKFNEVKSQFMRKDNQLMRAWSGKDAEQMWGEISEAKVFEKHQIRSVLLGYTYGSWKNHPNPADVLTYMTNDLREEFSEKSLIQATIFSIMSFIRLSSRYIDEIRTIQQKDVHENAAKTIREVFEYLDSDKFSLNK